MKKAGLYKTVALVTLLGLTLSCGAWPRVTPTPTPSPTSPPDTPPPPEPVSPIIIQRTPEAGEELSPDGVIQLVFDRAMDKRSVESALLVGPDVPGAVEWVDERTVSFKPDRTLKRDTEYLVTLGPQAKASDGKSIAGDYRFRFRTVGYLEVAQVIPAPDTEDVEAASTITVIFNRPVVPLTAVSDPDYADLPQPVVLAPAIEGSGEWLNTSIYVFTSKDGLAGGTTYTAHIEAGLEDTTGGVLDEDYTWSFTTQPPEVVWVSPSEDQELVSVDTAVQVTFNMPVDCDSATEAFTLSTTRDMVPGTFACQGATLTFTPTQRLAFGTTYSAMMKQGVQSAGGGVGMKAAYDWQFTTVPLPRILYTSPYDGQQDAWPWTAFEIIFNAPIDPVTVMPNLEMTPPISPSRVFTYFSTWNNSFVLDFGAEPSTDYEVRIGPGIADPYGNTTGQEMTVRFRTQPLTPWAIIHTPGTVGTYDANQPARIAIGYLNTPRLDLSLYRLGEDDFFRARQDWWRYSPTGAPIRQWSVSVDAPLNETGLTIADLAEGGGTLAPGIYMLDMQAAGVEQDSWSQRKLLVVSKYNLTLKKNEGEIWAWATDLVTGQLVNKMALSALSFEGDQLGQATTDEDGLAHFSARPKGDVFILSREPFALGSTDWDWSAGISPWDFGLQADSDYQGLRAIVYTDRPIYRPGQTVYFRGVFRDEDDVQYSLPTVRAINVVVRDTEWEEIYRERLSLDEFGAFHGELTLDEGAALGQYVIEVDIGTQRFSADFLVAAYRAPEFEVVVTPQKTELAAGQATKADVEVRYFSGGATADVVVEWNVLAVPYRFKPAQFGRYDFTDEDSPWICRWCWWEEPYPQPILSGTGTTNAEGHLAISLPTRVMTGGQRLTIEATAYGKDGQVISGRSDVVVHQGEFYVGLAPQRYVGQAGDEMAVDVVTVDWAGERLPRQALDLEVYRREWVNTFVEDAFGGGQWQWETVDTLVYSDTLTTDARAEGVATFTPQQGGSYRVAVSGRDRSERLVRSSTWVWVSGAEYISWRRENNDRITLISDKSVYVPGETAEILIPSPFEGEHWAWITVERGGVLQQKVLRLESNSAIYEVPITADHAPNIYVSVVLFKGAEGESVATHKVGYVLLTVEPVEQELDITLTPSVERAGPGDEVSFDVEARDADGQPVEAAFSLDLVDKAVLSLRPRVPDAILQTFYGQRGLGVSTSSGIAISINRLLVEQLEEIAKQYADTSRALGMGGGGGGEGEAVAEEPAMMPQADGDERDANGELPPGVELRERFEDTAFWDATVVTDESGRATVKIELPDNLTTWVFRAVGITADTKVGEETTELLATKPLLVRPVTPRFFVVGDRVQLAALVSNNTGEAQEVEIALIAKGLQVEGSASQQITIPDGGEAKVTWWVTVGDVEAVDVMMSAVAGEYSDAARPRLTTGPEGTLLVHRYTAPEVVGTGGQLVDEDTRVEAVALPPKYDPSTGSGRGDLQGALSIRLDPSLAAASASGLTYLEHFPYECTEQIVSRFLPNVLTYRAMQELGLSDPKLRAKLPGLVQEGLDKLYLRQRGDGGWGWWYADEERGESNPYLTAYVIFALSKADEVGFEVQADVVRRGLNYLNGQILRARDLKGYREANLQSFILYVMAEAGQTGRASEYVDDLYDRREKLSHYGRAFLAMTLGTVDDGDRRINTLLSDLQNEAILSATGAHWEEAEYDWWAMNTDTRSTAVILDALARLDPDNALIPNVVRWLMVARQDGIWETTQETAWALIALTDWMVVTGELEGEYNYAVRLNDRDLAEGAVTPDTIDEPIQLQVDVAELLSGTTNRLMIGRGEGEGRLYYTAHLKVYLPAEEIEPLDRGIIVSRRYTDPDCTDGLKCPQVDGAAVGDTVQVRLTIIAPHDLYYVVVEDPLPAGAEGVDTTLATTSVLEQQPGLYREAESEPWYDFYYWWWRWYSRSEMRDDKVVLFADYLPAGTYEYTYTFRATQVGEYQVIPTTAGEFYFPEVFGRGAGQLFTVTE